MVTSAKPADFRLAVSRHCNVEEIDDLIWHTAYDRVHEDDYVRSGATRAERKEAVREQARWVHEGIEQLKADAMSATARLDAMGVRKSRKRRASFDQQPDKNQGVDEDLGEIAEEQPGSLGFELTPYEEHRKATYELEIAAVVDDSNGDRINRFRKDWLNEVVLLPDDATNWLISPLANIAMSHFLYSDLNDDHRPVPRERLPRRDQVTLESREIKLGDQGDRVEEAVLLVVGERQTRRHPRRKALPRLTLPTGEVIEYWPNSLVEELVNMGNRIARYAPWPAEQAIWYILTGLVPTIDPLILRYTMRTGFHGWRRALLTIEVEPWVSMETLARLYQDARRQVLPPKWRPHPRGLAVLDFIENLPEELRPSLHDIVWKFAANEDWRKRRLSTRDLWGEWTARHPDLASVTITDVWNRWNEVHGPHERFHSLSKFRSALVSGLAHSHDIRQPDYRIPKN